MKPWPEFPLIPDAVWQIVQDEFRPFPDNLWGTTCRNAGDPQCPLGAILNRICWRANGNRADGPWGLSAKSQGYHVTSPVGPIASDILYYRGVGIWDVFSSAWTPLHGPMDEHPLDPNRPWLAPVHPDSPVPDPVDPEEPEEPLPTEGRPASLHAWIHEEYPQLVAAYEQRRDITPGHEWAAFQTYRRYVEGWPLSRMLEHERTG